MPVYPVDMSAPPATVPAIVPPTPPPPGDASSTIISNPTSITSATSVPVPPPPIAPELEEFANTLSLPASDAVRDMMMTQFAKLVKRNNEQAAQLENAQREQRALDEASFKSAMAIIEGAAQQLDNGEPMSPGERVQWEAAFKNSRPLFDQQQSRLVTAARHSRTTFKPSANVIGIMQDASRAPVFNNVPIASNSAVKRTADDAGLESRGQQQSQAMSNAAYFLEKMRRV